MDASPESGRLVRSALGRASSGADRVRALGTVGDSGAASTGSSLISALYLTCRICITCHKVSILAHTLQY